MRFRVSRNSLKLAILAVSFAVTSWNISSEGRAGDTYTSIEKAGSLYALQGEYVGTIEAWGGSWGAQVIAIGTDKLDVHLLNGGLPGDGFSEREPTKQTEAKVSGDVAKGGNDKFKVDVTSETLTVRDANGQKLGELKKAQRESKTMGLKPPEGAVVLFDGKNADSFQGGKLVDDQYLGVGCTSKDAFQDHKLHIEFRTPFQPTDFGQARGNSGVYIQGRYELQVLDSFGLRGEDNECGGIYQISRPKLNMCYPPLAWQTYDIDFTAAKYNSAGEKTTNARVTIRHNGVVIHDDLELPRGTPGKDKEASMPGSLYLQDHGNPVVFRNVWVMPTAATVRK